jgi:hypothetical protein
VLGLIRIRPAAASGEALRAAIVRQLAPELRDGIISMHLLENDPALSRPLTDPPDAPSPGAGDWYVLIDGTSLDAVGSAADQFDQPIASTASERVSTGIYTLLWDLAKADIAD